MKRLIMTITFCVLLFNLPAQEENSRRSSFGIQTGLSGVWINHEARIAKKLFIKSELGLDYGKWSSSYLGRKDFLWVPVLSLEPRWYFKTLKGKSEIQNKNLNADFFISLRTAFHPDWYSISNYEWIKTVPDLSINPTTGIKLILGKHLCGEAGLDFRFKFFFGKTGSYTKNSMNLSVSPLLRIGYYF